MFHRLTVRFLDVIQHVISSPYFFFATIIVTVVWMGTNFWMEHQGLTPFDPPKGFFPLTVLLYSLMALWIENAMKAQQRDQQEMAQRQIDKLTELSERLLEGQKVAMNTLSTLQDMVHENNDRDEVLHQVISVLDDTIEVVEKNTSQILDLQLGHSVASLFERGGETSDRSTSGNGPQSPSEHEGPTDAN